MLTAQHRFSFLLRFRFICSHLVSFLRKRIFVRRRMANKTKRYIFAALSVMARRNLRVRAAIHVQQCEYKRHLSPEFRVHLALGNLQFNWNCFVLALMMWYVTNTHSHTFHIRELMQSMQCAGQYQLTQSITMTNTCYKVIPKEPNSTVEQRRNKRGEKTAACEIYSSGRARNRNCEERGRTKRRENSKMIYYF